MAATTTETRPVEDFHAISLDGVGTLNFAQDDVTTLTVEAEEDALPLISTEVEDGVLHIRTEWKTSKVISYKHPPVYTITSPTLDGLDLRGAGRAVLGRLKSDQLAINVDGAGDVRLTNHNLGACRIEIAGAGNVKAAGTAKTQDIVILGTGNF